MAKLVLSLNGTVLGNYFLEKERFVIGRRPNCDIQINDQGVSKEHAVILTVGNDQILEDLKSTNGTLVNGRRIERHILQNGDVIEVGRYKIKYVNQKALPDMDFDKTLLIPAFDRTRLKEAGVELAINAGLQVETAVATARAVKNVFPLGAVRLLSGAGAGQEIELSRPITAFGRPGNRAIISRRPHGYFITHVSGRRPPLVNGRSIGVEPQALDNLDQIEIDGERLQFFLK
ncbi:FHA domain-containing protein [Thiobacter aerophilum]|uniref:FHA domain-containing protein n=1 Tax=Thiobacter aerophilum TaxID=3121275 RepID=A0ABV0EEW2_9BURK